MKNSIAGHEACNQEILLGYNIGQNMQTIIMRDWVRQKPSIHALKHPAQSCLMLHSSSPVSDHLRYNTLHAGAKYRKR